MKVGGFLQTVPQTAIYGIWAAIPNSHQDLYNPEFLFAPLWPLRDKCIIEAVLLILIGPPNRDTVSAAA